MKDSSNARSRPDLGILMTTQNAAPELLVERWFNTDHPLTLAIGPDGSLDPGASGPYQVHGRIVTGQNDNDDFTFAPLEQTCTLAVLTPSKTIPSGGGTAATMIASAGTRGAATAPGTLSTPAAPLGNATLSIVSGFPTQPGVPNPLAGRPYVLLRDSYANALAKGGVSVPPGTSPYKYVGTACGTRTPDCQKIMDAIKVDAAAAVRADANGSGTFPGVAPGIYYLMISARYSNQGLAWGQAVQLKSGPNSLALDLRNGAFETYPSQERTARAILWRLTIARLREANPQFLAANGFG